MNWIANQRTAFLAALLLTAGCNLPATESVSAGDPPAYAVTYTISIRQGEAEVDVSMRVRQGGALLREVRFARPPSMTQLRIDGHTVPDEDEVIWQPSASGGTLQWTSKVAHLRGSRRYDAFLSDDWGIFRAEDVIPRAATRAQKGAYSRTILKFELPESWSVITPYAAEDDGFPVVKADRNFDQPAGWMAVGKLGIRRETIAGMHVAVAAPTGQSVRRMDILALLNWTLPELSRALGTLPPRLTIISAGNPMWRGGLSGPHSLYIHADRPLISENATSTLLHEVMHSTLRQSARTGYDWIVEGLAEFYSLELLRRSGSISEARFQIAMEKQQEWAESADALCQESSKAATTALAVTVMYSLDAELRQLSGGDKSLDDLLQVLQESPDKISLAALQQATASLAGKPSDVLRLDNLPGCRSIQPDSKEPR